MIRRAYRQNLESSISAPSSWRRLNFMGRLLVVKGSKKKKIDIAKTHFKPLGNQKAIKECICYINQVLQRI